MSSRRPLTNITIGSDPECFIFDKKKNRVKSSVNLIPGTKQEPYAIEDFGRGFALQTDNILAEFNIPPVTSRDAFITNINMMKDFIRNFVQEKNPNLDILCAASQTVPKTELRSKQAREFGCDPDFNCYTLEQNVAQVAEDTQLRSAGFHIHVGYDHPEIDRSVRLLAYLDAYLGVPSILIDKDTLRRTLYGKSGCCRLTDYGCEYRTLSSYFMKDDAHIAWVFNQTVKAINAYNTCSPLPDKELVQSTINSNNTESAAALCRDYDLCADFLQS